MYSGEPPVSVEGVDVVVIPSPAARTAEEDVAVPFNASISEPVEADFIRQANECVIHLTKPIENLPSIGPEELKVIGRCIMFEAETLFNGEIRCMHYSGLVSSICFDTVSLINVTRFSEKLFEAFLQRKKAKDLKDAASGNAGRGEEMTGNSPDEFQEPHSDMLFHHSESTEDLSRCPHQLDRRAEREHLFSTDDSQSSYVYKVMSSTGKKLLKEFDEDFNAPFMTFSRKKIHNVQFSIDPPSSFYSLFRNPEKRFFDMQCLRMFARRYIVHTSHGNNPRKVPLKAFIVCRCNCPHIDDEMLIQITRQEIVYLFKLDAEIKRMGARVPPNHENTEERGTEGFTEVELHHMMIFRRFSQDTILIGVIELFFACLVLLIRYALWSEVSILSPYFHKFKTSTAMYWIFTLVLGMITSSHGRAINPYYTGSLGGVKLVRIILCIICMYWCCVMLVTGSNDLSTTKIQSYFTDAGQNSPIELQKFYDFFLCSGYDIPCTDPRANSTVLCTAAAMEYYSPFPCRPLLRGVVQRTIIPVVIVGLGSIALFSLDLFFLHRYSVHV